MFYANYVRERMKVPKFAEAEGNPITITDSLKRPFRNVSVLGESTQDGTPTPDIPIDIVSVENPIVKVTGKNLFDISKVDKTTNTPGHAWYAKYTLDTENRTIMTNNPVYERTVYIYAHEGLFLTAGDYTISYDTKVENETTDYRTITFRFYNEATGVNSKYFMFTLDKIGEWQRFTVNFNIECDGYINFAFQPSGNAQNRTNCYVYTRNIQIERGLTATEYEPYTEQTAALAGIKLCRINDYNGELITQDELIVDGKQKTVKLIKNTVEKVVTGTETISYTSMPATGVYCYKIIIDNVVSSRNNKAVFPCSHFKAIGNIFTISSMSVNQIKYYGANGRFDVTSSIPTASEFKTWLAGQHTAGTPVVILGWLHTPIETDITDTEAGQALLALYANNGTTNIFLDSASKKGDVWVKYERK